MCTAIRRISTVGIFHLQPAVVFALTFDERQREAKRYIPYTLSQKNLTKLSTEGTYKDNAIYLFTSTIKVQSIHITSIIPPKFLQCTKSNNDCQT